jgi:hypothetical protein
MRPCVIANERSLRAKQSPRNRETARNSSSDSGQRLALTKEGPPLAVTFQA